MSTVKVTNRTIEVSLIDEDYMMPTLLNVESVVFIPGAIDDIVDIVENSDQHAVNPTKTQLKSGDGEPRASYFRQRLQLGFVFTDGTFTADSKVIFNIGEI